MVSQPRKTMSSLVLRLYDACLMGAITCLTLVRQMSPTTRKSENGVKNEYTPDLETFTFRLTANLRKELELIVEYEIVYAVGAVVGLAYFGSAIGNVTMGIGSDALTSSEASIIILVIGAGVSLYLNRASL